MAPSFPLPTTADGVPDALLARFNTGDVDEMDAAELEAFRRTLK